MEMDWLLGYNYLLMGKNYDLLGDRVSAIYFYEKIKILDNLFNYKEYANNYINKPYSNVNNDPFFIQN